MYLSCMKAVFLFQPLWYLFLLDFEALSHRVENVEKPPQYRIG